MPQEMTMKITTQDTFADYKINETLGLVVGNSVQARWLGADFIANLKSIIGGEVSGYTALLATTRIQALERLSNESKRLGANGIACLRFTTSHVARGMTEILAFGTAVKISEK